MVHSSSEVLSPPRGQTLPGLTGLRGAAAIMVVGGHVVLAHTAGKITYLGGAVASAGVQVFFVLSGFLITTLLLREREVRQGQVSLRRFYARRALRLLPPLYLLLATTAVLVTAGLVTLTWSEVGAATVHVWNYSGFTAVPLNHVWSLNVEEHYYLLYPVLFVALSRKRLIILCAVIVIASPAIRLVSYVLEVGARDTVMTQTHNRLDALLLGCLLSLCWSTSWVQRVARTSASPLAQATILASFLAVLVGQVNLGPRYMVVIGFSAQAVLVALFIAGLQHSPTGVRRLLDTRLLGHLGVISYSLYLWQQLFTLPGLHVSWANNIAVSVMAPVAIAEVSYRLLEAPLGRVRRRLA